MDGGRSFDRIQSNAGNIGFAASVPTGMNDISVNVRCEQFTYFNHFGGGTGWCNRNSKIGLSHPQMGEIMFATWLLPYNEGVAQWVDPFYDAGADSHTSIMGRSVPTPSSTTPATLTCKRPIRTFSNGFDGNRQKLMTMELSKASRSSTIRGLPTTPASTVVRKTSFSTGRRTGTALCSASRGRLGSVTKLRA